jgi:thermolysin metallopeptidase-like protein/thrombospondin type 3 repeat protein
MPRMTVGKCLRALAVVAFTLLTTVHGVSAQGPDAVQSRVDSMVDAQWLSMLRLRLESKVFPTGTFAGGFPTLVQARVPAAGTNSAERARSFLNSYADLYGQGTASTGGLDHGLRLRLLTTDDAMGLVTFGQTWRGLPVLGAGLTVFVAGAEILGTSGSLIPGAAMMARGGERLDPRPRLTAVEAESRTRDTLYLGTELRIGTPILGVLPAGTFAEGIPEAPKLIWLLSFNDRGLHAYVDANSGAIWGTWASTEEAFDLEIRDAGQDYTWCGPKAAPIAGDENELAPGYASDLQAQNAFSGATLTHAFYLTKLGVDSFNDDGAKVKTFIHHGGMNAWYTNSCANTLHFSEGLARTDVMAHEWTHAVQNQLHPSGGLTYCNQAGALNESFADVMAALVDGNWSIGEGSIVGVIRDMANPPVYGHPDHMTSPYFHPPEPQCIGNGPLSNDSGWVHDNSGIPNKVWYLLGEGGTHRTYTVGEMLPNKVAALAFFEMVSLASSATFIDARNHAVLTAKTWQQMRTFGFTNGDRCSVQNAWASVGLGIGDRDCDGADDDQDPDLDGDWVVQAKDNCPLVPNPSQADTDGDGEGDACDIDDDADGVTDLADNCPAIPNPGQPDADANGVGDACEDTDGDRVVDGLDNCPAVYNPEQHDLDADGLGNVCDPDLDGDGVPNATDNCPEVWNPDQVDSDRAGTGDACDPAPLTDINEVPLEPGKPSRTISLEPKPSIRTIPLEPCPLPCHEGSRPPSVALALTRLPASASAWVSDATGRWVSDESYDPRISQTTLTFRPRPGERYQLNVIAEDGATFSVVLEPT